MKNISPYQQIQDDYEKWLRKKWEPVPIQNKRPDFRKVAIEYANCRRELDQAFQTEYGFPRPN